MSRRVDVAGAVLFTVAVASLMVALTEIGAPHGMAGPAAACVCLAGMVLLVLQERRATDPMLALGLWARRPIATANAATLLSGMVVIGLTAFLPVYVQGVMGRSALVAGFATTAMVLGWPIGATLAARNFARFGLRPTLLFGAALLPAGALVFVALRPDSPPVAAGLGSAVIGFGMGFLSTSAIVIVQGSVGWAERGVATASNIFSRNLGSALGAAVLGSVLNLALAHAGAAAVGPDQVRRLLDQPGGARCRRCRRKGGAPPGAPPHLLGRAAAHGAHAAPRHCSCPRSRPATGHASSRRRTERGVRWARAVQAAVAQLTRPAHAACRHGVPSLHAGASISLPAPRPCARR